MSVSVFEWQGNGRLWPSKYVCKQFDLAAFWHTLVIGVTTHYSQEKDIVNVCSIFFATALVFYVGGH